MGDGSKAMWDIFISHAWEDKETIAGPLAKALSQVGLHVWYDDLTLTLGDSLRRSIDRGLTESQYGVVILSPSFLAKEWPKRELDGLTAREVDSGKVILPVWHNVTREDILRFSPILADKLGIPTAKGLDTVVSEIVRVIQPKGIPSLVPDRGQTYPQKREQDPANPIADISPRFRLSPDNLLHWIKPLWWLLVSRGAWKEYRHILRRSVGLSKYNPYVKQQLLVAMRLANILLWAPLLLAWAWLAFSGFDLHIEQHGENKRIAPLYRYTWMISLVIVGGWFLSILKALELDMNTVLSTLVVCSGLVLGVVVAYLLAVFGNVGVIVAVIIATSFGALVVKSLGHILNPNYLITRSFTGYIATILAAPVSGLIVLVLYVAYRLP